MSTHDRNRTLRRGLTAAALALATLTTGCLEDDEPIVVETIGGELFARYVSLGNSITAGFQSGGIHAGTQQDAYPVLLAAKAEASFGIPALNRPGCPPPLDGPLGQPISEDPCQLPPRSFIAPPLVQNLAVPGADVAALTHPLGTGTSLNTFILGGRTQVGAMIDADPTLVSVWIGYNDALGAALSGDLAQLTSFDDFQSEYAEVAAAIASTDTHDAIIICVSNPALIAPALQPGAYFWAIAQNPPPGLPPLDVSDNCAPFTPDGTPNPGGARLVSFLGLQAQLAAGAIPIVVDCSAEAPFVLNAQELATISGRVAQFNGYIEQVANDNGWIYVDAMAFIGPALGDPSKVRKCQLLASATDPASFVAAVMNSCPVDLDPTTDETFFGSYISYDGVHPSSTGHAEIADVLADVINEKHGLALP